jgi:small-conductance mechanosensitive channel
MEQKREVIMQNSKTKLLLLIVISLLVSCALFIADTYLAVPNAESKSLWYLGAAIAAIIFLTSVFSIITHIYFEKKKKPIAEWAMVNRLFWLLGIFLSIIIILYGRGLLGKVGTLLSLFGGMVIGWSLQQPLSGLFAWILVNLKRPYHPGDRVQFPKLDLTGDIKDIGAMYMELNEVGGTIGSEEAVGRSIFIPNAMLFEQVVINYATINEAPYILDEIIVRITYDSKWDVAEKILINAATKVTHDVIQATEKKPYIRSELYDYGVYMQLRYQTKVVDRAKTSYKITKLIFEEIQRNPLVDVAIPYIYSYRAGRPERTLDEILEPSPKEVEQNIQEIDISLIEHGELEDSYDIEQLAKSIQTLGLMRPIILKENPEHGNYEILAGKLRLQACKKLNWKTIPSLIIANPGDNRFGHEYPYIKP